MFTDESSEASVEAVSALAEQAQRLGLKWRIVPATVIGNASDANNTPLVMDGDTVTIRAQSLIGQINSGIRVMVLVVPPSNVYIIGMYGVNAPALNPVYPMFQAGQTQVIVTATGSLTQAVTFKRPFATTPSVDVNISSGAGATASWNARGISVTPTGFTLFCFGPSSTFTTFVHWQAMAMTQ